MISGWSGIAVVIMMLIVLIVIAPLAMELGITVAERFGISWFRRSRVVYRLTAYLDRGSVLAEYGVAVATLAMMLLPIYLHFYEFAPFWRKTHNHQHGIAHMVFYHVLPSVWINTNMLFQFYYACTVKPESPNLAERTTRRCEICGGPKPIRSHHCSTCNRCVEKMDHHCPFTANCVGKGNFKFFYCFVTYGWIATLYAVFLSHHPYTECIQLRSSQTNTIIADIEPTFDSSLGNSDCGDWNGLKARLFYCSIAASLLLTTFWIFVTYLVYTDTTTIEFLSFADRKRQRDLLTTSQRHGALQNLQAFLGPWQFWLRYLIPSKQLQDSIPTYSSL